MSKIDGVEFVFLDFLLQVKCCDAYEYMGLDYDYVTCEVCKRKYKVNITYEEVTD